MVSGLDWSITTSSVLDDDGRNGRVGRLYDREFCGEEALVDLYTMDRLVCSCADLHAKRQATDLCRQACQSLAWTMAWARQPT